MFDQTIQELLGSILIYLNYSTPTWPIKIIICHVIKKRETKINLQTYMYSLQCMKQLRFWHVIHWIDSGKQKHNMIILSCYYTVDKYTFQSAEHQYIVAMLNP